MVSSASKIKQADVVWRRKRKIRNAILGDHAEWQFGEVVRKHQSLTSGQTVLQVVRSRMIHPPIACIINQNWQVKLSRSIRTKK